MIYRKFFTLAIPIMLQQLISLSVSFVDVLMLSRLGSEAIAAGGICNQIYFVFFALAMGIGGGMGVFMAQYWGKKDIEGIRKVLGMTLVCVLISFGFLMVIVFCLSKPLMIGISGGEDAQVIEMGVDYLRLVLFAYIFGAVTTCYSFALRSIGKPQPALYLSIFSVLCNILLNYILIFGKMGFPALGISGAAIATSVSKFLEMLLMIVYIYGFDKVLNGSKKQLLNFDGLLFKKFIQITIPVVMNDVMWSICMVLYSSAYSRVSTDAMAAVQVTNSIVNMFISVPVSLCSAASVIVGNMIGGAKIKESIENSRKYLRLSLLFGMVVGFLLFISQPLVFYCFTIEAELSSMVKSLLLIHSICMPIRSVCIMLLSGILRGGGDTT
ncbi:MAG: MATE family efflux transporter, partial [Clostridiales bacterium]